ncbi:hypothetical protein [Thioalkalivibrio sp. XN279]|uniref:hypothetical protein n=1 Tax=Thioalkalivibrio sp. XN279 TaxID=2714953 RepID=UPI0014081BAE|nr:hypothetical protein [Thioalkalivibrio sp. XN279]NHA14630.1 hypothetical protein [Thioalkalivibrio sp. XN279]
MMVVKLKISDGSWPELAAELERLPSSQRAQRIRILAHIGLIVSKNGISIVQGAPNPPGLETPTSKPSDAAKEQILGFGRPTKLGGHQP